MGRLDLNRLCDGVDPGGAVVLSALNVGIQIFSWF